MFDSCIIIDGVLKTLLQNPSLVEQNYQDRLKGSQTLKG